jgi:DNA-binding FadR family transcriptional regulator
LRDLRAIYAEMAEALDSAGEYAEAAMRFNLRLAEASGNPLLREIVRQLVNEQAALRHEFSAQPTPDELRETSLATHARLLDALESGAPEQIAAAVNAHMRGIRQIYLGDPESPHAFVPTLLPGI